MEEKLNDFPFTLIPIYTNLVLMCELVGCQAKHFGFGGFRNFDLLPSFRMHNRRLKKQTVEGKSGVKI